MFSDIVNSINDVLYSYVLIILLVLGGLYFTFRIKGSRRLWFLPLPESEPEIS